MAVEKENLDIINLLLTNKKLDANKISIFNFCFFNIIEQNITWSILMEYKLK